MSACSAGLRNESWHEVVMKWCLGLFYLFSSYIWHVQRACGMNRGMKLSWHGVGAIQSVKKGLSGLGWLVWHVLLCELYSACTAGLRIEMCYVYVNLIVNVYVYVDMYMYMYMYVYVYLYVLCVCVCVCVCARVRVCVCVCVCVCLLDQFGRIEPGNGVGLCSIRFLNQ